MRKNQLILEFSNFNNAYVKAIAYGKDGKVEKTHTIALDNRCIVDGTIFNEKEFATALKEAFPKPYPITLVVCCQEMYKNSLSFPQMPMWQAQIQYRKEIKAVTKPDYTLLTNATKHGGGIGFSSYFIPTRIVDTFKSVAKLVGARFAGVELFGNYLKENLPYTGNYAYMYLRRNTCSMILVVEDHVVTSYDFGYEDPSEIERNFLLVLSKHEFEFERQSISRYAIDSDFEYDLEAGLDRIDGKGTKKFKIKYDKSFLAKLILSTEETKQYYSDIKNVLLSYKGVKCRTSRKQDTFRYNKQVVAKLLVRGKTLCLLTSLPVDDYKEEFGVENEPANSAHTDTPCLFKITGTRRSAEARDLVAELMQKLGATQGEVPTEDYTKQLAKQTLEQLIESGMVKIEENF